jgi:hypothetical protein
MTKILDDHAPQKSKTIVILKKVPWFNKDIKAAKLKKRQLEKQWRRSKLEVHHQMFKCARNNFVYLLNSAKVSFFNSEVDKCSGDQKRLFSIVNDLLHHKGTPALPSRESFQQLSDSFRNFFVTKIETIRKKIDSCDVATTVEMTKPSNCPCILDVFDPTTEAEIAKIIASSKNASCSLDPLPT